MRILSWCRANAVLSISLLAALITACIVPPDRDYAGYYDIKTLVCLFSVLAVVGALRDMQVFAALSQRMVRTFRTVRSVCTALVIVTMFGSMLLTNDTALLTFLPLSWFVLQATGQEKHAAMLFILQNCAANLCGMITPFGNPQNLYLFSFFNIPIGTFIAIMLPPFLLSAALILLCCLTFPKEALCVPEAVVTLEPRRAAAYGLLFCLAVAMVLRAVPYQTGLLITVAPLLILDRHAPKTMLVSALTSQIISNVPAAILLSRFTDDYRGLLVGVNVGGAGTLVASLASLITFCEYTKRLPQESGRFLLRFSAVSFALLAILLAAMALLGC